MRKIYKLGNKVINYKNPTYIIAEVGVNHNGDINIAKKLIREAKLAGADCIKFQTFSSSKLVSKTATKAKYQKLTTNSKESQYTMLKKLELDKDDHVKLLNFCRKEKITFLSTPYNFDDADFLDKIGVSAFKLASMHLTEHFYLKYISKKKKPFILSTGMSDIKDVDAALKYLNNEKIYNYSLLQCTTNYPTADYEANINVIKTFINKYKCVVGYSDHTQNPLSCMIAVSIGARIIEKHFTLDKQMNGPDHSSSMNPKEFKNMVTSIRETEILLGSEKKFKNKNEVLNEKNMKRSIVARIDIPKGSKITYEMLDFMRPLNGIKPNKIKKIIGKKVKYNIKKFSRINQNMIEK